MWLDLLRCILGGLMSSFHAQPVSASVLRRLTRVTFSWLSSYSLMCLCCSRSKPPFIWFSQPKKKIAVQTTDVCAGPRPPLLKRMTCSCTLAKFHTTYCSESSEAGDMITRVTDSQLPASISYRFSCPKPAEKAREIWPERHNCAAKKERQPKGWEGWLKQSFYAARQKHKSHFSYRGGCGVWPAVLSQWSTTCGASVGLDHIKGAAWKNACGAWWEDARRLVTTAFLSA